MNHVATLHQPPHPPLAALRRRRGAGRADHRRPLAPAHAGRDRARVHRHVSAPPSTRRARPASSSVTSFPLRSPANCGASRSKPAPKCGPARRCWPSSTRSPRRCSTPAPARRPRPSATPPWRTWKRRAPRSVSPPANCAASRSSMPKGRSPSRNWRSAQLREASAAKEQAAAESALRQAEAELAEFAADQRLRDQLPPAIPFRSKRRPAAACCASSRRMRAWSPPARRWWRSVTRPTSKSSSKCSPGMARPSRPAPRWSWNNGAGASRCRPKSASSNRRPSPRFRPSASRNSGSMSSPTS